MRRAHLWTWVKPEFCIFRDGPSVTTMKWQGVTTQTLGRGSRSGGSCFSCLVVMVPSPGPFPPLWPSYTDVLHHESLSRFQP